MKKQWCFAFLGVVLCLSGCTKEQRVVIEPTIYQYDEAIIEDQAVSSIALSLFFRSNTEVTSAKITAIEDMQGEKLLNPSFVSGRVHKVEYDELKTKENDTLYQLHFFVNLNAGGKAHFTKLQLAINDEVYEVLGEYTINRNHPQEDFLKRRDEESASRMTHRICLNAYDIPKDAKNIKLSSPNPSIRIISMEDRQSMEECYSWSGVLEKPYMNYGTTILLQYELDGKMIQKYLPELRGNYQNLIY